ncbi:MAG: VWA domain-containing protein [Chroococcidiopsidaceae cyanobacterium CP_BM_RX_35]|nr:VWA domain-containing protein [Chroococcidiopsidaceae cyanobacterium CP_BM_RX_35]
MLEFAFPWLFSILPLPLLIRWFLPPYGTPQEGLRVPFFQKLVDLTGQTPTKGATILRPNWVQRLLVPLCWLLLVTALARPQLLAAPVVQVQSARDLMLLVDLSQSMEAEDFYNEQGSPINRLDAVKLVLNDFIDRRQGDRVGLILFGTKAYLQVPFTQDLETARFLLDEAQIGMAGAQTMLGDAIGFAIQAFETSKADRRVAILLTDGNDTGSQVPPQQAAEIAAQKHITLYTIAIGDPTTAGEQKLDEDTLKEITDTTGGAFFRASDREGLESIYQRLDQIEPQEFNSRSYQPKQELFQVPVAILFVLTIGYHLVMAILSQRRRIGQANHS